MWKYSGGLPYFAQLFGHHSVMQLISNYGSAKELFQDSRLKGPARISKEAFMQLINNIHHYIPNIYEECARKLFDAVSGDFSVIDCLVSENGWNTFVFEHPEGSTNILERIEDVCNSDNLMKKLINTQKDNVKILTQY